MSLNKIDERYDGELKVHGKFSLSIATSLAIETLFGINDNVPPSNPLPYKQFDYLYINVRTMIRNLHGAVNKELKTIWSVDKYMEELLNELEVLPEIVRDYSDKTLEVVFYLDSYKELKRLYPKANFKEIKGGVAMMNALLEEEIVKRLSTSSYAKNYSINLIRSNLHVPKKMSSLIMTHLPVDLISLLHESRVSLIESHTGVIKNKNQWYTKLNGKDLDRIPFNEFSLQVFGDGKTFSGLPHRYKTALVKHANDNWWNQSFTLKLIKQSLKSMKDKEVQHELLALL